MTQQSVMIRSLDWVQAPAPKDCDRSLTIVICEVAERSQEFEAAMAPHYPSSIMRVILGTERARRQYSNEEWTAICRRCSLVLGSVDGEAKEQGHITSQGPTIELKDMSTSHMVVYTSDVDYVPRQVLACADLMFWYNGNGSPETHAWSQLQVNKYMRHCTGLLMGETATATWRSGLVELNPWLSTCQHWIGMDIRCVQRTWITLPLLPQSQEQKIPVPSPVPSLVET